MEIKYALSDPWLLQPLPLYGQLTPADYAELGFMCGLEVHQQLLTERQALLIGVGLSLEGKHPG